MLPVVVRQIAAYSLVGVLIVYTWKDWFRGLCGLILLTTVMNRPEFPQSLGGVQGLNLWNTLFANVFLAWLVNRRREGCAWDMPASINILLMLWLGVILVGWVRMVLDRSELPQWGLVDFISEHLINTIKWPIVGLLLFDGCRTRRRVQWALACTLLFFALFTVQMIKHVSPSVVLEPGNLRARNRIPEDIGISINGMAKMLSGVPWGVLAIMPLAKRRSRRLLLFGAGLVSLYAVALAGSRMGYLGCGAAVVLLCLLRWRRYLLLLPLAVVILYVALPGATARMLSGFGETDISGETATNDYTVTAGRNKFWPYVVAKIHESPIVGFGREALVRTGLHRTIENEVGYQDAVTHPHSAYLEVLLDSGLIGFVVVVGLYTFILVYSARLFVDRGDPLYTAAGGLALALLTGHLVASLGGQSFYPMEIDVGLWCGIGVMFRLAVERHYLVIQRDRTLLFSTPISSDIAGSPLSVRWTHS
jgi:O-antigen ligase